MNSKRAITECLENALEGQGSLDCDLIIIYSAMGHNFKDLLSEARRLSPSARIAGCTCSGIIGKNGPDESMTALAIMAVKGPASEFEVCHKLKEDDIDSFLEGANLAQKLKSQNGNIKMILFLPSFQEWKPFDRAIEGIESVFGPDLPIFGGVALDNFKAVNCFHFFDDQVFESGAVMIGFGDISLKFVSHANHGFGVIEGMNLTITRCKANIIHEFNGIPAWIKLTEVLGIPETSYFMEALAIAGFAKELPPELQPGYNSRYFPFGIMWKNDDNSIKVGITCEDGQRIWLTRRDEKTMFDGLDHLVKKILEELKESRPLAVFHADCVVRGRISLNRILKDELINRIQSPICKGENIPYIGLYSGGELGMVGGHNMINNFSSTLFVIYRE